jgi:ubiquitin-conjugating enzyme E2 variant
LLRSAHVAPVVSFELLFALGVLELGPLLRTPGSLVAALCGVLPGWLFADFGSGIVHWLCDRFGDERTPVVGPLVIAPFREHHVDPQILARKGFAEAASSNAWLALGLVGGWLWIGRALEGAVSAFVGTFVLSLAAAVFLTNTFHQWAHQQEPPRTARWLQRLRLAIPPERHALHHAGGGDGAYCVTTGWCNPTLDRWGFFPRLEEALARLRSDRR